MNTIQFQYFPKNNQIPEYLQNIVNVFNTNSSSICSLHNELDSNTVLRIVSNGLISLGFEIEKKQKARRQNPSSCFIWEKWENGAIF